MNEKLIYREMLQIPTNTCNITYKQPKRKFLNNRKKEIVKDKVIEKINANNNTEATLSQAQLNDIDIISSEKENLGTSSITSAISNNKKRKPHFKITAVGVELCVICALIFTILLSSAVLPNSGIKAFFSSAFIKEEQPIVDSRVFSDFSPIFSSISQEDAVTDNGIMTVSNQKSLYSPCDGRAVSVAQDENGLYNIVIAHSENFKTVIDGAKYCYVKENDQVYRTIPIAHADDGEITICFVDAQNNVITENALSTCSVLWK